MDLSGQTVVITGAASGIGRALALGFLRDGATVLGADRDAAGLEPVRESGGLVQRCDVSEQAEVQALVARAVRDTGRIDVLFNNAGVLIEKAIPEHAPDELERVFRIMTFGPYYGMHAAIPVMREQGHGRIVNTVSRVLEISSAGHSAYGSAKAALWVMTRVASQELKGTDVLVNGLIPGPTRTAMTPSFDQPPEAVYPTALMLATLPEGGPSGKVFWNEKEYVLFADGNLNVWR